MSLAFGRALSGKFKHSLSRCAFQDDGLFDQGCNHVDVGAALVAARIAVRR